MKWNKQGPTSWNLRWVHQPFQWVRATVATTRGLTSVESFEHTSGARSRNSRRKNQFPPALFGTVLFPDVHPESAEVILYVYIYYPHYMTSLDPTKPFIFIKFGALWARQNLWGYGRTVHAKFWPWWMPSDPSYDHFCVPCCDPTCKSLLMKFS